MRRSGRGRRVAMLSAVGMLAATVWTPAPAAAEAGAFPAAQGESARSLPARQPPPPPRELCRITDDRIGELSGLAADGDQWYAVNDGGTRIEVFVLGADCAVRRVITAPADPYDVEDLALSQDGTLWLADTGDNRKQRPNVALHAVRPDGSTTLYRLRYPDGAHDAEALLLDREGTPFIVTKNLLGGSEIYRPAVPLATPGPVDLQKVGELSVAATDTQGGPVGGTGTVLVTGAASNPDRSVIALRTYTDAYLYPAPDGDIVAALARQPVRVPLPGEQQGEAIALTPEGTLLSASEGVGGPVRGVDGAAASVTTGGSDQPQQGGEAAPQGDDRDGVPVLPSAAIAIGMAMAGYFGVRALWRLRR